MTDTDQWFGAAISIIGSSISIAALNAQKWALEKEHGSGGWRWTLSIILYLAGQIVQTAAFAYGNVCRTNVP